MKREPEKERICRESNERRGNLLWREEKPEPKKAWSLWEGTRKCSVYHHHETPQTRTRAKKPKKRMDSLSPNIT
jgi:hypothetical protein